MKNNNSNEPKKVQIKIKLRTLIVIVTLIVMLLASNVFAGVMGYDNVFFMIKDLVVTKTADSEEDIFSDREIVISYKNINCGNDVKLQIQKILLENGKSTLYLRMANPNKSAVIIELYDTNRAKKLDQVNYQTTKFEDNSTIDFTMETDVNLIELNNITLAVDIINDSVRYIDIDISKREIVVEGTEELKKISEVELKKYLGVFSIMNSFDFEENDKLVYIADLMSEEILENNESNRETINNIIKSFYDSELEFKDVDGKEVLELGNAYNYNEKADEYRVNEDASFPKGICLSIEDITYKDGIYKIEYIYCLSYSEDDEIENLPQYMNTVELKYDVNSKYSKYKIIKLNEGFEIEKDDIVNNEEVADDYNIGTYVIENKNLKKGVTYSIWYFDSNGNYKSIEDTCKKDGEINFIIKNPQGVYTIGLIIRKDDSSNYITTNGLKIEFDKNGNGKKVEEKANEENIKDNENEEKENVTGLYIIKNSALKKGNVYNIYYFDQNGNYKSVKATAEYEGEVTFKIQNPNGEYQIGIITLENNASEFIKVDGLKIRFDEFGNGYTISGSSEVKEEIQSVNINTLTGKNYGDKLNYSVTVNGKVLDTWRIFYNDKNSDSVKVIYDGYLDNDVIDLTMYGMERNDSKVYCMKKENSKDMGTLYTNLTQIAYWSGFETDDFEGTAKLIVTGAPTLDDWVASWNEKGYKKMYTKQENFGVDWGKKVGYSKGNEDFYLSIDSNMEGYYDDLYFPYNEYVGGASSYWLATPSAHENNMMLVEGCAGNKVISFYEGYHASALRPVLHFDGDVKVHQESDGSWTIDSVR